MQLRLHWREALVLVLIIPIAVLFVLIVPLIGKVSTQSRNGQAALTRQCSLLPASTKIYLDAQKRGVVSTADVNRFFTSASAACHRVVKP